jgi:hypothetical protein
VNGNHYLRQPSTRRVRMAQVLETTTCVNRAPPTLQPKLHDPSYVVGMSPRSAIVAACIGLVVGCAEEPVVELATDLPEPPSFPPAPGTPAADADTWYAECGTDLVFSMAELLPGIADGMVRQRIPYGWTSPDEWRDCSGNFLRFSSYVASACPAGRDDLAAPPGIADYLRGGDNVAGLLPRARDSRELARWYFEHDRFVPIWYDQPQKGGLPPLLEDSRYLIKPGAVLWFSANRPYERGGIEQLFARNVRGTQIKHLGTVVSVEHDDDGQVVGYAMYHGRNPDRAGSVTDGHSIHGTGDGPPFGNGGEFLVGIGTLLPLAEPPDAADAEPPVE